MVAKNRISDFVGVLMGVGEGVVCDILNGGENQPILILTKIVNLNKRLIFLKYDNKTIFICS